MFPACPFNEFRCVSDHSCIPRCQVCDGYAQCDDSSDELSCGTDDIQVNYFTLVLHDSDRSYNVIIIQVKCAFHIEGNSVEK